MRVTWFNTWTNTQLDYPEEYLPLIGLGFSYCRGDSAIDPSTITFHFCVWAIQLVWNPQRG